VCAKDLRGESVCRSVTIEIKGIEGCTDYFADNYDADATEDDGSCEYSGCTDNDAYNYDPDATKDDGSCVIFGCDDPSATNVINFGGLYSGGDGSEIAVTSRSLYPGTKTTISFEMSIFDSLFNTTAIRQRNLGGADIATYDYNGVLVNVIHELGHVLSISHISDNGDVMSIWTTNIITAEIPELTSADKAALHSTCGI